jgi:hypothetical protein
MTVGATRPQICLKRLVDRRVLMQRCVSDSKFNALCNGETASLK